MPVSYKFGFMMLTLYSAAVLDELDEETVHKLEYLLGKNWMEEIKDTFNEKNILKHIRYYKKCGNRLQSIGMHLTSKHLKPVGLPTLILKK